MTDIKKLYGVCVQIDGAEGYQTFGVMATSREDAAKRWNNGESTGKILDNEVEVYGLSKVPACSDDVEEYFDWKPDSDIVSQLKADKEELVMVLTNLSKVIPSNSQSIRDEMNKLIQKHKGD